ncbi:unnamed protein product [Periconia digitata]|uniref:Uncharacterized protein n=1 Tax=Periconia digitata TaxID=1303443 RepID=A0A9W4U9N4_9PLEO|nr:unnamed protein product [Periconia digitata]
MPSPTPKPSFLRSAALYLTEPHPYGRRPVTMASATIPWANYPKRIARTGVLVLPTLAFVLGWPLAGAWFYNGKM